VACMTTGIDALKLAISDHFKTQGAAAKAVGVTPQAVSEIVRIGKKVPAEWCLPIERATEGKITRHELRPDLYPLENAPASQDANTSEAA
ncbi:Cro/CI family transcriptional regulator, partial [Pseudomonas aeruginosa]|nr:Cro/CI family transcriptional regulator [Pseudomonas aeruginosa]